MTSTPLERIASHTSGATTTTWAPATCRAASFEAATGPPPTTSTRRPCNFRNAGNNAMTTSPSTQLPVPSSSSVVTGNWQLETGNFLKQKSPGGFGLPGFGYISLRWTAVQDINAWTEGREGLRAAYSSNNYRRRCSLRTFGQL